MRRLPDETGVLVALIALVVVVGVLRPNFFLPATLFQQLSGAAFIGMLALAMVFVVAIRDIDLSVGWMFNFSAVIAAKAMVAGVDPWLAAGMGIAFGGLLGLVNGLLAVWLRIPVIIITLGHAVGVPRPEPRRQRVPGGRAAGQDELVLRPVRHQGLRPDPDRRRPVPRRWPCCSTCCSTAPGSATGSRPWAATPTRPGWRASRSTARGSWCSC